MKTFLAICAIVAAYMAFLGYRGHKTLKRRDSFLRQLRETDKTELQYLDLVSYHGGLPEIPKPQKLHIAVTKDYLLLFSSPQRFCKVAFGRWRSIETFTTKPKQAPVKQSLLFWGPLVQLLNKEMLRHFIVIHYMDSENQVNNLLIELSSREKAEEVYEKLRSESGLS